MKKKLLCLMAIGALVAQDQASAVMRRTRHQGAAGGAVGQRVVEVQPRQVQPQQLLRRQVQPGAVVDGGGVFAGLMRNAGFNANMLRPGYGAQLANLERRVNGTLDNAAQAQRAAEGAQHNAEEARDQAVRAQRNAEEARDQAVQAQRNAEGARDRAVADQQDAERARDQAVQAQRNAERDLNQAVQARQNAERDLNQAVQARQDAERERDQAQTGRDIAKYLAGYDPYKFSHVAIVDPHLADLSNNLNDAGKVLYMNARLHEQGDTPIDGTVFIAALENYMRYVKEDKRVVAGAQLEAGENGQVIIPAQVEDHADSVMHSYRPDFELEIIPDANYFWENALRDAIQEHADAALHALQQNAALRATNHPWSRVNLQAEDVRLSDVACVAAYNILVRAENAVADGEAAVDRNVQIDYVCSEVVKAKSVKIGSFETRDFDQVYKDAKSAAPVILDAMAQYRQNPANARHLAPKSNFFARLMYFMYYTAQQAQREENGWTPLRIQSVLKCLDEMNGLEVEERRAVQPAGNNEAAAAGNDRAAPAVGGNGQGNGNNAGDQPA